jgi:hypothetical protein
MHVLWEILLLPWAGRNRIMEAYLTTVCIGVVAILLAFPDQALETSALLDIGWKIEPRLIALPFALKAAFSGSWTSVECAGETLLPAPPLPRRSSRIVSLVLALVQVRPVRHAANVVPVHGGGCVREYPHHGVLASRSDARPSTMLEYSYYAAALALAGTALTAWLSYRASYKAAQINAAAAQVNASAASLDINLKVGRHTAVSLYVVWTLCASNTPYFNRTPIDTLRERVPARQNLKVRSVVSLC